MAMQKCHRGEKQHKTTTTKSKYYSIIKPHMKCSKYAYFYNFKTTLIQAI